MNMTPAISSSFRAGVLESPGTLSIQTIPQWVLEAFGDSDLMLIGVAACGVCGSDLRYFAGENPWAQHTLGHFVPNPPNIVLGHEYAGTVLAVVDDSNAHWLGKRVAPICSKVCGKCDDCLAGNRHLCPNTVHMGHGQGWGEQPFFPGAYGRYSLAWGSECFELADDISFAEGAMMDILAVGVHAVRVAGTVRDRPVACIGVGPAGNAIAQAALADGASQAVLIDRSPTALAVARDQGFGTVIDSRELSAEELRFELRRLAPAGFGAVFDTVGTAETFDLGLRILGKAGAMVCLAIHEEAFEFRPMRLGSERRLTTSCNFERSDFEQALAWLEQRRLRVTEWLSPVSLEEIPGLFQQATADGAKSAFKWLIEFP
jgi:threonine dehydrogenase-like Zn-dependent dehydrogenase